MAIAPRRETAASEEVKVDLYEYQGRELFARHGLPVLSGGVAETPEEATAIAQRVGRQVVVKAQVKVGGRVSVIQRAIRSPPAADVLRSNARYTR